MLNSASEEDKGKKIWEKSKRASISFTSLTQKNVKSKVRAKEQERKKKFHRHAYKVRSGFKDGTYNVSGLDVNKKQDITEDEFLERLKRKYEGKRMRPEGLREFIAKKKEMLMVQLTINSKKKEIRRLGVVSDQRDKELKDMEVNIEKEAVNFDAYLKENNKKAQETLLEADRQTKKKKELEETLEGLFEDAEVLKNEIASFQEVLEDCQMYQNFLIQFDFITNQVEADDTAEPTSEKNLLDVFSELEQNTLLLMQKCQHAGGIYDALSSEIDAAKVAKEKVVQEFDAQVKKYEIELEKENLKISSMEEKLRQGGYKEMMLETSETSESNGSKENPFGVMLQKIHEKTVNVLHPLGLVSSLKDSPSILPLLTVLEQKIDEMLKKLDTFADETLYPLEKSREKTRREYVRLKKAQAQQNIQDAKLKKMKERNLRTQKLTEKKKEKPVMFRSYLKSPVKESKELDLEKEGDVEDDSDFI